MMNCITQKTWTYWHNFHAMGTILIVLVRFLVCQHSMTVEAAKINYGDISCSDSDKSWLSYTNGSVYESNLKLLLNNLTSKSSSLKFYNYTVGTGSDTVYGLFQCRYDLSPEDCYECVKYLGSYIKVECGFSSEAIVWYYECMVRYAGRNFFSLSDTDPLAIRPGGNRNVSNYAEFRPRLKSTLIDLNDKASSTIPHFAINETEWASIERGIAMHSVLLTLIVWTVLDV